MAKGFYWGLAKSNLLRSRQTYLPQLIATAVMSGVFLLISGLTMSDKLSNLPTGKTAAAIFLMGMAVFAVFSVFFMLYINRVLVGRRQREFGLYGVLGLEKRHVARILFYENLMVQGLGLLCGMLLALVFGRLLFWVLLKLIRAAAPDSQFFLAPKAFLWTFLLFSAIFAVNMLVNLRQIRTTSPMQLMQRERQGEPKLTGTVPLFIAGAAMLTVAYSVSWTIEQPIVALFVFFTLVILVIAATYLLFPAGSAVVLRLLRADKRFYYRPGNFVTVSGLIHRMRQNAKGLASICILSTMFIVTISGTLALYFGQKEMLDGMYPYDMEVRFADSVGDGEVRTFEKTLFTLADAHGLTLSADPAKLVTQPSEDDAESGAGIYPVGDTPGSELKRNNHVYPDSRFVPLERLICFDASMRFDCEGDEESCLAFVQDVLQAYRTAFTDVPNRIVSEVFTSRQDGYGLYGGLLFLGVFFGLLFLAVTVLIIYFKQLSEGFEDRQRFSILQKVGMDDVQVRGMINRQVLILFFLPLAATMLHMVFASKIMARMLQSFVLYDLWLVLACIGGTLAVFAAVYLSVYRLTARIYYGIVRR